METFSKFAQWISDLLLDFARSIHKVNMVSYDTGRDPKIRSKISNQQHAKWATTDANRRSRATQQMYKYLNGELPRVPETAVETYKSLVDQGRPTRLYSALI